MNETSQAILRSIEQYKISPMNPEFRRFIEEYNSRNSQESDAEGRSLGLIPSPIDIGTLMSGGVLDANQPFDTILGSQSSASYSPPVTAASPTSWFDLRMTGKLTPVRDQEQCGACWAFSTYGSLESTNLPGERWDFSENNMKNTHGFDLDPCKGGNYQMSTAYLARWSGAVSEAADPYLSTSSTSGGNVPVVQHVQDVIFLPSRTGPLDNAQIKQLLQQNGAVYSQIRWESGYYNKKLASYYYPGSSPANHAVVIVGWDDSYSRTRFSTAPPGDGAFIVRNSWGEDWGEYGYCYVSYYDTCIGRPSAQFLSEDASNYDRVYQYDPFGWVTSVGVGGDSAWFANVFTSTQKEELKAVSFYTPVPNAQYQVEIFNDVGTTPRGRSPSLVQQGSISYAGYHTIPLLSSVPLQKGQKFSVIVKLTTPGFQYPIAVEYPYPGYSSRASARAGESWVSSDGTSWTDLTTVYANSNVCVKAFTDAAPSTPTYTPTTLPTGIPTMPPTSTDRRTPTVSISSPKFMGSYAPGDEVRIEWSAQDNVAVVNVVIEYSADKGNSWNTILQHAPAAGKHSWIIPENLSGSITIRVRAFDAAGNTGSSTRSITIKTAGISSRLSSPQHTTPSGNGLVFSPAGTLQSSPSETREFLRSSYREENFIPAVTRPPATGGFV
ncbi:MAG TPA: lectin like domain-containing protein [Methanolinea sp.]|nr:lectin like domain-containing protein [Methanolinea sp.]